MSATPIYSYNPAPHRCSNRTVLSAVASRQIGFFEHQHLPRPLSSDEHRLYGPRHLRFSIRGVGGHRAKNSPWDEEPFKVLPSGKRAYLDEQDVVSFLDPPRDLVPLDPSSYNPASYLWKKIGDIPEERRYRLLHFLKPRLVSRAWKISGTKYDDPKLRERSASSLLSVENGSMSLEYWNCKKSGGPMAIAWINFFRMALFRCKNGKTCGRFMGGSFLARFFNSLSPLYFEVSHLRQVMSTEEPCDLAFEFLDGFFELDDYPQNFPRPAKHPWPFDDQVVVYVRHVGPGVMIGQAWQEGKVLEQVPQKLCGEILMVRDYSDFSEDH